MTTIKELIRRGTQYWFVNGWKADSIIFKSKWKPALMWVPHLILLSTLFVYYTTLSTRLTLFLLIIGLLLYALSLILWQGKAYTYIMDKEGIGKKPKEKSEEVS